jgi:DNA-binding transcriptional ArsR family regulator
MLAQHPDLHLVRLENVLAALSNPLRLEIVRVLAGGGEHACGTVLDGVSKSTLTRHWQVLRDNGIIRQRPYGRENLLSLRRDDLDARFPGLLDAVLSAADQARTEMSLDSPDE